MSEALNLAENFKAKSQQQAKVIEQEVQNATTQLNSFMKAKLKESEAIIKDGMDSLDTSNEQLQTLITTQKSSIDIALKTYIKQLQAPLTEDLNDLVKGTQTLIESYSQHIETLIEQREGRLAKFIKAEVRTWAIVAGIALLVIFVLGVLLGTKMNKPTTYKYYHDSKSGQNYMLPLKD